MVERVLSWPRRCRGRAGQGVVRPGVRRASFEVEFGVERSALWLASVGRAAPAPDPGDRGPASHVLSQRGPTPARPGFQGFQRVQGSLGSRVEWSGVERTAQTEPAGGCQRCTFLQQLPPIHEVGTYLTYLPNKVSASCSCQG